MLAGPEATTEWPTLLIRLALVLCLSHGLTRLWWRNTRTFGFAIQPASAGKRRKSNRSLVQKATTRSPPTRGPYGREKRADCHRSEPESVTDPSETRPDSGQACPFELTGCDASYKPRVSAC